MKRNLPKKAGFLGSTKVNPLMLINVFTDLAKQAIDTVKFCEEQETERTRINAQRDAVLARINAQKEIIRDYLEKTFDERRKLFDEFFDMADKAIESGNNEHLAEVLTEINQLAASSPFTDLEIVKEALKNKKELDF